jgi:hypothetical protein
MFNKQFKMWQHGQHEGTLTLLLRQGIVLFYNVSAFRSDAYLRNCRLGVFLGNKCTDEHICFVMYFMIEVMDVW